jgi:hypothetical protein
MLHVTLHVDALGLRRPAPQYGVLNRTLLCVTNTINHKAHGRFFDSQQRYRTYIVSPANTNAPSIPVNMLREAGMLKKN